MPAVAVGGAVSAMAAQNIGAGKWDRIDRIAIAGCAINVMMSGVLLGTMTIFAVPILELFVAPGSAVIPIAVHINHVVGWSFLLMGVSVVVTFLVRANGAVTMPLLILIISAIGVRFLVGFGLHPQYGADAIWWAFIAAAMTSFTLSVSYYVFGGWKKLAPMVR